MQFIKSSIALFLLVVSFAVPAWADTSSEEFRSALTTYVNNSPDLEDKEALLSLIEGLDATTYQSMYAEHKKTIDGLVADIKDHEKAAGAFVLGQIKSGIEASMALVSGAMVAAWQVDCTLNPRRYTIVESAYNDEEISLYQSCDVDSTAFAESAFTCVAFACAKFKGLSRNLLAKQQLPEKIRQQIEQLFPVSQSTKQSAEQSVEQSAELKHR